MREIGEIIEAIEKYKPETDWLGLDDLLQELFSHPMNKVPAEPLLSVFERYPTEDGYGVFWVIVHGVEDIPNYELALLASLKKTPSLFGLTMAKRILNSGSHRHLHEAVRAVARTIARSRRLEPEVREEVDLLLADKSGS